MTLRYGYVKGKLASDPVLRGSRRRNDTQYHLHFNMTVAGQPWDIAVNVGSDDARDLLKFRLVSDFRHPLIKTLGGAEPGAHDLTGLNKLPALDFVRSADLFAGAAGWRDSGLMDSSATVEPAASLKRMLVTAKEKGFDVCVFGRFYKGGDLGIHDTHMNQGSTGEFIHRAGDDRNDHNDIWQDGAVFVDTGEVAWAAYFAAFNQQLVPTDDLGNPAPGAKTI